MDWRACNGEAEADAVNARMAAREVVVKRILDWRSECCMSEWCMLVDGVVSWYREYLALYNSRHFEYEVHVML